MPTTLWVLMAALCLTARAYADSSISVPTETIELWKGVAPGEKGDIGEELSSRSTKTNDLVSGRPITVVERVSNPTITIYRPPATNDVGAAAVVCPGGGYFILAMDIEGTEVCEWLNSIGVTAVLLKYRVPRREGLEKHTAAFQDVQRAISLVRFRAREFGIDPNRIGVLGFSAGGHLAAAASNDYQQRSYTNIDEADLASCRPDFSILIYPAYLTVEKENDKIAPELNINSNTPPTFIAMTEDDPLRVENALSYAAALHKAGVPFELHVYSKGGHGYGLRPTTNLVTTWPERAKEWMSSRSLLGIK